jgi:hypothetical protein
MRRRVLNADNLFPQIAMPMGMDTDCERANQNHGMAPELSREVISTYMAKTLIVSGKALT